MNENFHSDPEPVFVVGMNGSGTTMLLDCLGRHAALYAFPRETRLIPHLIARLPEFGDLADDVNYARLWDEVRRLGVFVDANGGMPVPLPEDWRAHGRSLGAVLDAVFRHFAAREGKRRWCEKTPQHVQHLERLADQFPAARFVHVIRDGRDCAASFHRRWRHRPELTVFRWKKVVAMGREQGRRLGAARYLEVRYEDVTAEPELALRRICRFLDLPFDRAVLDSAQPYLEAPAAAEDRGLRRNSGKWRSYFGPRIAERLERIAGRELARCGYATRMPESDLEVPPLRRKVWSAAESARMYAGEVWRKLNGEIERPWSAILRKPGVALRHRQHNVF